MADQNQSTILELLSSFRGMDPLKQLFWSELNYDRVNKPLGRRSWSASANQALADDPLLFASGGDQDTFHVIYCRLAGPLRLTAQR